MRIENPFKMNDWEFKKFFRVILAIHLVLWGLIGLDAIGFHLPIIRPIIAFIYLTFIPGFVILRALKIHGIESIESLLYAAGLSIATIMFVGAFINAVCPSIGISEPISCAPLLVTIGAIVFILCAICYTIDKDLHGISSIDSKDILSPSMLFLFLLPLLVIFGTYAVNFYNDDCILLFAICAIPIIAAIIGLGLLIPDKMFPLAVFIISLSLLFRNSLISTYIWGWDINIELYLCNLVNMNSIWDPKIAMTCNAMLSLVMLAPIYSIFSNMSIIWVFKIIYPILFCLVPLGLYRVFQKQTDDRIAFVSCLFFMSFYVFYTEMLQLARQEIAELFLVLLILTMIDESVGKLKRSVLAVIFCISLTVSHYGLSYIFMLCLISAWAMLVLSKKSDLHKLINNIPSKMDSPRISLIFVLLFVVFTLTWYMFMSDSSAFNAIGLVGKHILSSISTDFLNPDSAQGLKLITQERGTSLINRINQIINYSNQIFIVLGGIVLLLQRELRMKFRPEYIAFAEINVGLCIAGVSVPYFASSLNMSRLYQITLIFLAPVCVIGGIAFVRWIIRISGKSWSSRHMILLVKFFSVYFAIFLLYQSGVVIWATEGYKGSFMVYNSSIDFPRFNDREISGAIWLNNARDNKFTFSDQNRGLLMGSLSWDQFNRSVDESNYVYLGTFNIINGNITIAHVEKAIKSSYYMSCKSLIYDKNLIYYNGGAQVYG